MIINELIGKKVVVHVEAGANVVQHRGILEAADSNYVKLKKDSETIFFSIHNVIGIQGV